MTIFEILKSATIISSDGSSIDVESFKGKILGIYFGAYSVPTGVDRA